MKTHRQLSLSKESLLNGSFALLTLAIAPLACSQTPAAAAPDDVAVHQRVDALLKEMTLDEKLGQLNRLFDFAPSKAIDEAGLLGFPAGSRGNCHHPRRPPQQTRRAG